MEAEWFLVISTLILAFVALFKDSIWQFILKPNIDVEFDLSSPDCFKGKLKTEWIQEQNGKKVKKYVMSNMFYYKIRIINNGKSPARNVEVIIQDVRRKKGDDFNRIDFFVVDNLDWSSSLMIAGAKGIRYYKYIFPNTFKHCELGHILDPSKRNLVPSEGKPNLSTKDKTIFSLNIETRYHSLHHLLEPGIYRIKILIAGENFKLFKKEYELEITGKWFEDEEIMLSEGLKLKEI